jgi:carbon monoxide dehydrogenase subunit G
MGSIYREVVVRAPLSDVWSAVRDVAEAADLFPGILTASRLQGKDERVVTFSNGLVVTERIVDVDDEHRRVAYSALGENFEHHSASMQVSDGGGDATRFIWITDFLPNDAISLLEPLIDEGMRSFQRRWEADEER